MAIPTSAPRFVLVQQGSATIVNFDLIPRKSSGNPKIAVTRAHAKKVKQRNEARLMAIKGVAGAGIGRSKDKYPLYIFS